MKKKLIQILMLSVVAVSVGSFVSCKDTNEDLYNELNTQTAQLRADNATLAQALAEWELTLQQLIGEYEGTLDEINNKVGRDEFNDAISDLTTQITNQYNTLSVLIGDLQNALADKADQTEIVRLEGLIDDLRTQVNNNETLLQTLLDADLINRVTKNETNITTLQTAVDDLKTLLAGMDQCNNANFSDVLQRLAKLETQVPLIQSQVNQLLTDVATAQSTANNAATAAALAQQTADAAKTLAERLEGKYGELEEKLNQYALQASELAGKFDGLATRLTTVEGIVSQHTSQISALDSRVSTLERDYSVLSTDVQTALSTAREAYAKAQANELEIATLKGQITALQNKDTALDGEISKLQTSINNLNTSIDNLRTSLEEKINGNSTEITKLWAAIDALKLAGTSTQATIDDLADRICCLETQVGLLEGALAVEVAASVTHYEMAKKYADEQIHLLEMKLTKYIDDKLMEYLANNPDIDLSKYATREEVQNLLANYATQADLANLRGELAPAVAALQTALANLTNDVILHGTSIADLLNRVSTLETNVATNTADINWLKYFYETLSNKVDGIESKVDGMDGKLSNYISRDEFDEWLKLMEEAIKNGGNNNNIGNDYNVDLTLPSIVVQVIVNKIAETLDEKVSEKLAELLKDKDFMDAFGKSLVEELGLLTADDLKDFNFMTEDDVKALLAPIQALAEANQKDIEDHEDRIKELENKIQNLADLIVDDKVIDVLKTIFATKDDIKDFLTEDQVKDILKDYLSDSEITNYLTNYYTKTEVVNVINDILKDYYTKTEVNNLITNSVTNDYLTENYYTKTDVINLINVTETKVQGLSDAVDDINDEIEGMKEDIQNLKDAVKENTEAIEKINDEIATIKGDVTELEKKLAELQEKLAKQVTGIEIQGTYNPMFGSFNIPVNIQSNVLLAYFGLPVSDGEFPTAKTAHYTDAAQAFSSSEIALLKSQGMEPFEFYASDPLLNEDGNAGKVYMTINPNTADVDGLQLSIVNSLDEAAPIRLKPIRKSNVKLQFGFSRANNGFYEAQAYVEPDDVMNKSNGISLTREDVTNAFKDVKEEVIAIAKSYNSGASRDLGQVASDVYQVVRGMKMDRTGLKCTYTTTETDASGATVSKENSVYSKYDLAATFFNPLNLKTAKDFNFVTMPGYEAVDDLINKFSRTVKNKFSNFLHTATGGINNIIDGIEIEKITLVDLKDETIARFEITIGDDVTIDGLTYHMQLPADAIVEVMYERGLKYNGQPVRVPAELTIDSSNPNVTVPTIVVYDDVRSAGTGTVEEIPMKLVIPVTNDAVTKFVWYDLNDESVNLEKSISASDELIIDGKRVAQFTTDATAGGYGLTSINSRVALSEMIDLSSGTTPTLSLSFTYDLRDEMAEVWGNAQTAVGNIREMIEDLLDEINRNLDQINNYESKFNSAVDTAVDDYLRKYLDKINGSVVGFVNSINRRFGPFMAASTNKGLKRLSGSKEQPTKLSTDDIKFYPTTKSLELFVPLARKHVAVTNVFKGEANAQAGDADCLAKMKAVNNAADINTVFDGTKRSLDVTGMVKGYTYEIAYSILDFEGNMSTHRYYVVIN